MTRSGALMCEEVAMHSMHRSLTRGEVWIYNERRNILDPNDPEYYVQGLPFNVSNEREAFLSVLTLFLECPDDLYFTHDFTRGIVSMAYSVENVVGHYIGRGISLGRYLDTVRENFPKVYHNIMPCITKLIERDYIKQPDLIAKWAKESLLALSGLNRDVVRLHDPGDYTYNVDEVGRPYKFLTNNGDGTDIEVLVRIGYNPNVPTNRMDIFNPPCISRCLNAYQWGALIRNGFNIHSAIEDVPHSIYRELCLGLCYGLYDKVPFTSHDLYTNLVKNGNEAEEVSRGWRTFLDNSVGKLVVDTKVPVEIIQERFDTVSDAIRMYHHVVIFRDLHEELSFLPCFGRFPGGFEAREMAKRFKGINYQHLAESMTTLDEAICAAVELSIVPFGDIPDVRPGIYNGEHISFLSGMYKRKALSIILESIPVYDISRPWIESLTDWNQILSVYNKLVHYIPTTLQQWRMYFKEYLSQL